MTIMTLDFWTALFSIVILDLVLAGDNAVVIAMAAHRLPDELKKKAEEKPEANNTDQTNTSNENQTEGNTN